MKNPEFIVYAGAMFSGKTSKMLLQLEKYKHQHKSIAVFKPTIDDRYAVNSIVSHGGLTINAKVVNSGADVLGALIEFADNNQKIDVVAVDEAFMIPGIAEVLVYVFRLGVTVIVSTLDLSAAGKPFKEVEKMMPWATVIEKCSAACTVCGQDARYTHKKQTGGAEIEVGGAELYEPRCAQHHPLIFSDLINQRGMNGQDKGNDS